MGYHYHIPSPFTAESIMQFPLLPLLPLGKKTRSMLKPFPVSGVPGGKGKPS